MNRAGSEQPGLIWSLWLAAAIVFIGGLLPIFFGGTSSRVSGVYLPYTVGALALVACAMLNTQSRTIVAIVYFVAGLSIIFGLLSMFALPIRLAALGSCPVAPYPCTTGLPRAMSDAENTGVGSAAAFGIIGLLLGFYGLVTLYRRAVMEPSTPPVRKIPPIAPAQPEAEIVKAAPVAEAKEAAPVAASPSAPAEDLELPAPEELPELPPHESSAPTT